MVCFFKYDPPESNIGFSQSDNQYTNTALFDIIYFSDVESNKIVDPVDQKWDMRLIPLK